MKKLNFWERQQKKEKTKNPDVSKSRNQSVTISDGWMEVSQISNKKSRKVFQKPARKKALIQDE